MRFALLIVLSILVGPASAGASELVHCTVGNISGHGWFTFWTTAQACQKRIAEAQAELAAHPPRPPITGPNSIAALAIKKYCATATGLSCSLYTGDVARCVPLAIQGYSILIYERRMIQRGITPQQAANLAMRSAVQGPFPPNPDDLYFIANAALSVPDENAPEDFRDALLQQCIEAAAR